MDIKIVNWDHLYSYTQLGSLFLMNKKFWNSMVMVNTIEFQFFPSKAAIVPLYVL